MIHFLYFTSVNYAFKTFLQCINKFLSSETYVSCISATLTYFLDFFFNKSINFYLQKRMSIIFLQLSHISLDSFFNESTNFLRNLCHLYFCNSHIFIELGKRILNNTLQSQVIHFSWNFPHLLKFSNI